MLFKWPSINRVIEYITPSLPYAGAGIWRQKTEARSVLPFFTVLILKLLQGDDHQYCPIVHDKRTHYSSVL